MRICNSCGSQLPDNATECRFCGAPLQAQKYVPKPPNRQAQSYQQHNRYQQYQQYPQDNRANPFQDYQQQTPLGTKHSVPKCTCCGYIGPWKIGPIFNDIDWVIGALLFLFFAVIGGVIYMLVIYMIRSDESKRDKLCARCNAKNMFTFLY